MKKIMNEKCSICGKPLTTEEEIELGKHIACAHSMHQEEGDEGGE